MSRLPIRARLTAVFAVATILVLAAAALFVYARLKADLDEAVDERLGARIAAPATPVGDPEDAFVETLAPGRRSRALAPEELRRAATRPIVVERDVEGLDGRVRIRAQARSGVVVVAGESLEDRDETLNGLLASFAVGGAAAVLLASVLGYVLAALALRPVESMRRHAAAISLGGLDERLPLPATQDEIRRLGETLNEMLGRLGHAFARERRFVADASHELRTPLAVLKTELEGALRAGAEPRDALLAALEECDHLAQLSEDLLVLAEAGDGALAVDRQPIDALELLEAARARFEDRAAAHGREIAVDASSGLTLRADPLRMRQALGNLVDNALRHGAGRILLRAREGEVAVTDEGAGVDARMFERFARGDAARTRGGAGLGLAIVRAIAEAHGGEASADGATVRLRLPG